MPRISNFKGLITDADGADLPSGASKEQTNVVTSVLGELTPRRGIQPATFSTTATLSSGYDTFQKMCFCKTRKGEVVGVNGLNRGFYWDGVSATSVPLGITAPTVTPTITRAAITVITAIADSNGGSAGGEYRITTSTNHGFETNDTVLVGNVTGTGAMAADINGKKFEITKVSVTQFDLNDTEFSGAYVAGGACSKDGTGTTKGDYLCAYRYVDLQSTPIYSSLSPGTEVTALTADDLTWAAPPASSENRVDAIELWRTTAGVTNVYFKIAQFGASGNITSSADSSGKIIFTVPEGHRVVIGQKITVASSSVGADNATHEVTAVTDTTITTATASTGGSHSGSGGTWTNAGYIDNVDDDTLNISDSENVLLIVANPPTDNTIVGRRFEPPPTDMAYCVMFQDRYFYFGAVNYNKGTIHNANNADNKTITGDGTSWTSEMVGRYIEVSGTNKSVKIETVTDADTIVLEEVLGLAIPDSGKKSYVIAPEKSKWRTIYYSYQDEPESVPSSNALLLQENSGDDDAIIGAMPYGPYLYILSQRHKYALSYSQDPIRDGSIKYIDDRGAFNHDCWDYYGNEAFLMDESGCYKFSGSESTSISDTIQNMFRPDSDGDRIDLTKSQNFFVKCDRAKEKVYFFVCFVGDSGNYPQRALVYNIKRESFDPMHYPVQITSASSVEKNGQSRLLFSAENEKLYLADEGNTDVVTSETKGTCSSSSNTTLVDSSRTFTSGMIGASVYIYGGTGKGQRRTILTASSHTLGVATWTTNPDTTSKYVIGAVVWNWKTSTFEFQESEERSDREIVLNFEPTTNAQTIDVRLYYNKEDTASTFETAQELGDAVQIVYENRQDVVFNIGKNYNELQESVGKERFNFDGMSSIMGYHDHQLAVEMRGYSAAEQQKINAIEIRGVGGGEG